MMKIGIIKNSGVEMMSREHLLVLAEDHGLVPSTCIIVNNSLCSTLWPLWGLHVCGAQAWMWSKHLYTFSTVHVKILNKNMILSTLAFTLCRIENWGEIARFCFHRSIKESYNPIYLIYQEKKRNCERNHSSVF